MKEQQMSEKLNEETAWFSLDLFKKLSKTEWEVDNAIKILR